MDDQNYYKILGIPLSADLEDLKKAYRQKVKIYHPDVSRLPDAEEHFIRLTEAYEILLRKLLNPIPEQAIQADPSESFIREMRQKEWFRQQMEKIQQMAREQARMKFEDFKKTPTYRTTRTLSHGSDYVVLFLGFFFIVFAFIGVIEQYSRNDLHIPNVFAALCVTLIGLIIIFYSIHQIRKYRKGFLKTGKSTSC